MSSEKFHNTSITIKGLLGLIEAKDIAIPEIQRPFVWKNSQVRDLIDSLYKGYPTGYIILWKNPNVKLKDGTISSGKKVIIDGQQRITALMTAIAAQKVFNNEFKESRVKIAFNPFAALEYANGDSEAKMFAVQTPAHIKSKNWIPDISEIFSTKFSSWTFIPKYIEENPEMSGNDLQQVLDQLKSVETTQIGVIELSEKLDIDVVTDIFIRINSKGTPLSQGDFVMSKMAADEQHEVILSVRLLTISAIWLLFRHIMSTSKITIKILHLPHICKNFHGLQTTRKRYMIQDVTMLYVLLLCTN